MWAVLQQDGPNHLGAVALIRALSVAAADLRTKKPQPAETSSIRVYAHCARSAKGAAAPGRRAPLPAAARASSASSATPNSVCGAGWLVTC